MNQMNMRKANIEDIPEIFSLINTYAQQELLLSRSLGSIYESIRDFVIVREENHLIATGSLHIIWDNLSEIRSLAVDPKYTRKGLGRKIVEFLREEAQELRIHKLFALTYNPEFFQKCGFSIVSKDIFPQKVWQDCINCIKFPNCDEIAVELILDTKRG